MLITTNQTITQWGHVFGDEMIASAVLDRVLHHSHVLGDPGRQLPATSEETGRASRFE